MAFASVEPTSAKPRSDEFLRSMSDASVDSFVSVDSS